VRNRPRLRGAATNRQADGETVGSDGPAGERDAHEDRLAATSVVDGASSQSEKRYQGDSYQKVTM
jgi:hypothetical protein